MKIRNITDCSNDIIGSNTRANATADTTHSFLMGTITITASKTFEIRHRSSATRATDGFGQADSFGNVEVYTQVKITRKK